METRETQQEFEPERIIQARNPFYEFSLKSTQTLFGLTDQGTSGSENVPDGPVILAPTHRGFNDVPAIAMALPEKDLVFLAKKELFFPPLGWWFRAAGVIPVDRRNPEPETFHMAISSLNDDKSLVIFPEQRVKTGPEVDKIHRGFGIIACLAGGVPIVPVGIAGSERFKRFFHPRSLHVDFGEPIFPPDLSELYDPSDESIINGQNQRLVIKATREILDETKQAMEKCLAKAHKQLAIK